MTTKTKTARFGNYTATTADGVRAHLTAFDSNGESYWLGAKRIVGKRLDCYELDCPLATQLELVKQLRA